MSNSKKKLFPIPDEYQAQFFYKNDWVTEVDWDINFTSLISLHKLHNLFYFYQRLGKEGESREASLVQRFRRKNNGIWWFPNLDIFSEKSLLPCYCHQAVFDKRDKNAFCKHTFSSLACIYKVPKHIQFVFANGFLIILSGIHGWNLELIWGWMCVQ